MYNWHTIFTMVYLSKFEIIEFTLKRCNHSFNAAWNRKSKETKLWISVKILKNSLNWKAWKPCGDLMVKNLVKYIHFELWLTSSHTLLLGRYWPHLSTMPSFPSTICSQLNYFLYQSGNSELISFACVVFPGSQNVLKAFKISEVQGCTVAVEAITWGNI